MGELSTLYGCIQGRMLIHLDEQYLFGNHNKEVINQLPIDTPNQKSLIVRPMFTVPMREDFSTGAYYRVQMIHFAASYNHLRHHWDEWKQQFERLLRQLYWVTASVHVDGDSMNTTFEWQADITPLYETPPQAITSWKSRGWNSDWETLAE